MAIFGLKMVISEFKLFNDPSDPFLKFRNFFNSTQKFMKSL